jgi:CubicO group peptidase (beta-lactamase class C family)
MRSNLKLFSVTVLCFSFALSAMLPAGVAYAKPAIKKSAAKPTKLDAKSERAIAIIEDALKTGPYPGIAVAVSKGNKTIFKGGFGYSDLERKIKVKSDTQFPIGSVTKSFTCLGAQQLRAKGQLDPDKTVGYYLPDVKGPNADVTLVQLMEHTSGIPNYTDLPDFPHGKPVGLSKQDVLNIFSSKPLLFTPGTEFNYSNSDTFLLGLIIEKISGLSYDEYVKQNILIPFGMTKTNLEANDNGDVNRARGYRKSKDGFTRSIAYDYSVPFSAGVIVSTAEDLMKYRQGVFGPKANKTVKKYVTELDPLVGGDPNPYSRGCLIETEFGGHKKLTHSGDIYGFSAHYSYYPEDDLSIAVLTNSQGSFPPVTIEHRLARVFLNIPVPDTTEKKLPADFAKSLVGDYELGKFRFGFGKLGFNYTGEKLEMIVEGVKSGIPPYELRYIGNNRFISEKDHENIYDFKLNLDGSTEVAMQYYEGILKGKRPAPSKVGGN